MFYHCSCINTNFACRALLALQLGNFVTIISLNMDPADQQQHVHAVPEDIHNLAKQAAQTAAAGHVQELLEALKKQGIAHEATVKCWQVLVSMCNRGGYGIDPWDVQENISDIAETKFHPSLFKGLLTDIQPSDLQSIVDFNIAQVEASDGILAPVEAQKSTYVSLWGGTLLKG